MEDLTKADFRTIKTFITNNITAERLLLDILQQSANEKQAKKDSKAKDQEAQETVDPSTHESTIMTATKDASEEPSDSQTQKMDGLDHEHHENHEDTEKLERRRKMKN